MKNKKELLENSILKNKKILKWYSDINKELKNKTIYYVTKHKIEEKGNDKGSIGKHIELYVFKIKPNNRNEPDLIDKKIEIKTTGMKMGENGYLVAKERLKFSSISYKKLSRDDIFISSSFFKKNRNIIIVFYKYETNKDKNDYLILQAKLFDLLTLDEIDQIEKDYDTIVKKIKNGKAHEISGSDTKILEACTSGANSQSLVKQPFSNIDAKKRSFAFKNAFVTKLFYRAIDNFEYLDEYKTLDDVINKIIIYKNRKVSELYKYFNQESTSKNSRHHLILKILNVKNLNEIKPIIEENVSIITNCLNKSNNFKEEFQLTKISKEDMNLDVDFEETYFYEIIANKKIMLVTFKEDPNDINDELLDNVYVFTFTKDDLSLASKVYEHTKKIFNYGIAKIEVKGKNEYNFIKISDDKVFHVRPKARDSKDTYTTQYGEEIVKQAFWINKKEIKKKIE